MTVAAKQLGRLRVYETMRVASHRQFGLGQRGGVERRASRHDWVVGQGVLRRAVLVRRRKVYQAEHANEENRAAALAAGGPPTPLFYNTVLPHQRAEMTAAEAAARLPLVSLAETAATKLALVRRGAASQLHCKNWHRHELTKVQTLAQRELTTLYSSEEDKGAEE